MKSCELRAPQKPPSHRDRWLEIVRSIYRVVLAQGGFIIHPPPQARGHFYNLSTKTVEPYRP